MKSVQPMPTVADIKAEYNASAVSGDDDFHKCKWGSHASMVGRFYAAMELVDFSSLDSWLDVGCGPGSFFEAVLSRNHSLTRLLGIDLSREMIRFARQKPFPPMVEFLEASIDQLDGVGTFDLVTLIGVLQQCGHSPVHVAQKIAQAVNPGGKVFLTTKHIGWSAFTSGELTPENGHSWFTMQELRDALQAAGLKVLREGGLLPVDIRFVAPEESHTVYFLAELA